MPKIPETSLERQETFIEKDPNATYLVLCGDDRGVTAESAAELTKAYPEVESPFEAIRLYGGKIGVARVFATVVAAQYGIDFLKDSYSNDFHTFVGEVGNRVEENNNVILGVHSAEANEHNPGHVDDDSEDAIGCAYAKGVNAVTAITQTADIIELSHNEDGALLTTPKDIKMIVKANSEVGDLFFNPENGTDAGFDRKALVGLNSPVAILEGAHGSVDTTTLVFNFAHDKVSQPKKAFESKIGFYVEDITQVAELLIKGFPELDLDIDTLLSVIAHDSRATREALASSEGKHAVDLKIERNGSASEAKSYLQTVKESIKK